MLQRVAFSVGFLRSWPVTACCCGCCCCCFSLPRLLLFVAPAAAFRCPGCCFSLPLLLLFVAPVAAFRCPGCRNFVFLVVFLCFVLGLVFVVIFAAAGGVVGCPHAQKVSELQYSIVGRPGVALRRGTARRRCQHIRTSVSRSPEDVSLVQKKLKSQPELSSSTSQKFVHHRRGRPTPLR